MSQPGARGSLSRDSQQSPLPPAGPLVQRAASDMPPDASLQPLLAWEEHGTATMEHERAHLHLRRHRRWTSAPGRISCTPWCPRAQQRLPRPPPRPLHAKAEARQKEEELRMVQRYLTTLAEESGLSRFTYSLPAERSLKVAIRGLPADIEPQYILQELRYKPDYVRHIKARQGRPGCVFHAVLQRTPDTRTLHDIYNCH
uniref:Uncharacterized protein n=1 Tax=Heliothis virescens TaxID=7102 RepID=A0A2A4J897_HELVI